MLNQNLWRVNTGTVKRRIRIEIFQFSNHFLTFFFVWVIFAFWIRIWILNPI